MKTPKQSFRIWFSPRVGSSLLSKCLEQTEVAGKPGEFFTLHEHPSMCAKNGVANYEDLRADLWQQGTSLNGVFGIKAVYDPRVIREIKTLQFGENSNVTDGEALADLFPNCKDIYLTRRNKIRQAVSWWKAIKDNVWHVEAGNTKVLNGGQFYEDNYDFAALSHLLKEATLRECAMEDFFARSGIAPLTVVYEDLISDFTSNFKRILDHLEIAEKPQEGNAWFYRKTADAESEKWVQRFREDLQEGAEVKTW